MESVGIDLVHIPDFAEQLDTPGSRFLAVFHPGELRRAQRKPRRAEHLAGLWAAKEAFVKAWSQTMFGQPPLIAPDLLDFREIEVQQDSFGRVQLAFHGEVADALGEDWRASISISHDGDYATAMCYMVATANR